jgi:hypothetical protein
VLEKLFQGLFGAGTTTTGQGQGHANAGQTTQPEVPFAFLNQSGPGLVDAVMAYINTGNHEDVLPKIEAVSANLQQTMAGSARNEIERQVWQFREQPEALWRYAQVLQALNLKEYKRFKTHQHRAHINEAVVDFLHWTVSAERQWSNDKSTTVADLLYVVQRLGGTAADLVSYSIPIAHAYIQQRFHMNVNKIGWEVLPVTAFSEALSKCDAKTRALGFCAFKDMPQIKDPAFLPFIFEQFEDSTKGLHDVARDLLKLHDKEVTHQKAVELLGSKKASVRESAVNILGWLGTE